MMKTGRRTFNGRAGTSLVPRLSACVNEGRGKGWGGKEREGRGEEKESLVSTVRACVKNPQNSGACKLSVFLRVYYAVMT